MKKLFLCLALCSSACYFNDNEAAKAMQDNGFSNVKVIDHGSFTKTWHGCSKSDQVYYTVQATNPLGRQVDMVVCCGGPLSFKGCTIRSN